MNLVWWHQTILKESIYNLLILTVRFALRLKIEEGLYTDSIVVCALPSLFFC
jgi:hypothetical protein